MGFETVTRSLPPKSGFKVHVEHPYLQDELKSPHIWVKNGVLSFAKFLLSRRGITFQQPFRARIIKREMFLINCLSDVFYTFYCH